MPFSTVHGSGNIPEYLATAFEGVTREADTLRRRPAGVYEAEQLARPPAALADARRRIVTQESGAHRPHHERAAYLANESTGPAGDLQRYLNPYQDAVTRNVERSGRRFLRDTVMPELDARFIKLGQHGSSRHARLAEKAARNVSRDIMSQQQESLHHGYQQAYQNFNSDKERQLRAADLMNKLGVSRQMSNLAQAQSLGELGSEEQAQEQRRLSLQYERWKEKERDEMERLNSYLSVLQGVPYVPTTYRRTEIPAAPTPARSMHREDWRNMGLRFGARALGSLFARGGPVKYKKPVFMR